LSRKEDPLHRAFICMLRRFLPNAGLSTAITDEEWAESLHYKVDYEFHGTRVKRLTLAKEEDCSTE
jgi:hypothetical protein